MEPSDEVSREELTNLLNRVHRGDDAAQAELIRQIYSQLHTIAARQMRRERANHTLQPTILVHEAFLHLLGDAPINWQNRAHFYALASKVMRRVLVDHARAAKAQKRPNALQRVELDSAIGQIENKSVDVIAIDEALGRLARMDPRQTQVVELKFFAGLSFQEISEMLAISERTAKRDWEMARAWLHTQLASAKRGEPRA